MVGILYKSKLGHLFGPKENILFNLLTAEDPFLTILVLKEANS